MTQTEDDWLTDEKQAQFKKDMKDWVEWAKQVYGEDYQEKTPDNCWFCDKSLGASRDLMIEKPLSKQTLHNGRVEIEATAMMMIKGVCPKCYKEQQDRARAWTCEQEAKLSKELDG